MSNRIAPRTPTRQNYQCVLSPDTYLPPAAVEMATAIQRSHTPAYAVNLEDSPGVATTRSIQNEVNLHVVCGSAGVLEFQLIREGAVPFNRINVIAGQKIEGHFLRIGPNTTCFPLLGFGNLP